MPLAKEGRIGCIRMGEFMPQKKRFDDLDEMRKDAERLGEAVDAALAKKAKPSAPAKAAAGTRKGGLKASRTG
jgi:hypothetical protein